MNAFIKYEKQPLTYQAIKIKAKQLPFFWEETPMAGRQENANEFSDLVPRGKIAGISIGEKHEELRTLSK